MPLERIRFEFRIINTKELDPITLAELGLEGWGLVTCAPKGEDHYLIFQRQADEQFLQHQAELARREHAQKQAMQQQQKIMVPMGLVGGDGRGPN